MSGAQVLTREGTTGLAGVRASAGTRPSTGTGGTTDPTGVAGLPRETGSTGADDTPTRTPLLSARGIVRDYRLPGRGRVRHAVRGVDLDVHEGEVVALIGESGSGKSTLVRILLGLDTATSGEVSFQGRSVRRGRAPATRWLRRGTGIVLQDPYGSLDPRHTVGRIVAEPLRALRVDTDHRRAVLEVLERVGLPAWRADQYPHELSGGQRQRVALARAIVHGPRLLVGDEPLSALDVTVRAQVLELLRDLHRESGMAILLVSHDIGLVQSFADRVNVMNDGLVVERGDAAEVLGAPKHPYTRSLVSAVPAVPEPDGGPDLRPVHP